MHEGAELAQILRECRIEHRELAGMWNELFSHWQARNDLTIRWLTEEWTLGEETHQKIGACLRQIMDRRMTRLTDYLTTGRVGSAERDRIDQLIRPLAFVSRKEGY